MLNKVFKYGAASRLNPIRIMPVILLFLFSFLATKLHAQQWELVWADEFTNGISSDWVYDIGNGPGGWGNNELQYYRAENASVSNGNLVITAKKESYGGFNYTSAKLKTQGKRSFKYGRIEARISAPSSMGMWPAFWMLGSNINSVGWPACGEIDILEHVNTDSSIHGTIHWLDHNNTYANYGTSTPTNVTAYHVYAIEWTPTEIRWYIDGYQYHVANIYGGINGTHEFHNDFFLILDLAVGGNWPGFNIDNSKLPAKMLVDYVRVYRDASATGPSSSLASSSSSSSAPSGSLYGHTIVSSSSVQFFVNNAPWADIHYIINNGAQQNLRMTHNADNSNTFTVNNIPAGAQVKYFFTIGQGSGATDTAWTQFTLSASNNPPKKDEPKNPAPKPKK